MTYTKQHATENLAIYAAALPALRAVGWTPNNEPYNWRALSVRVLNELLQRFPEVPEKRIRHQILRVMAEYRGYKKAEWK